MRAVFRIARATFQEAVRRRVLNIILIFGVGVIAVSWFFSYLQPGAELKMMNDMCLGAIRFFGMLIAVFMGALLIPSEIEKKTIHVILAKPVSRAHVIFGKFLGAWFTVLVNVLLMSVAFVIVFLLKAPSLAGKEGVHMTFMLPNIIKACLLALFELLVLVSIAVAASTIMSWVVTAVFCFAVYFGGQFSSFIQHLSSPNINPNIFARLLLGTIYTLLPHFDQFDLREHIVGDQFIPWWPPIIAPIAYGLFYTVVVMLIGYIFFNRREV
jgi:Cu-processing system permease protein